ITYRLGEFRQQLTRLERLRLTLGYHATLARGFAVVHGPQGLLKTAEAAAANPDWQVEFADGRLAARPVADPASPSPEPAARKPPPYAETAKPQKTPKKPDQGSLF